MAVRTRPPLPVMVVVMRPPTLRRAGVGARVSLIRAPVVSWVEMNAAMWGERASAGSSGTVAAMPSSRSQVWKLRVPGNVQGLAAP